MDAVRALTERCEILEEENRQLREALAPRIGFPDEWRLTRAETNVLRCLYSSPKHERTQEAMRKAVSPHTSSDKLIHVYISKLRKKLAPFGIEIRTMWGSGYKIEKDSAELIAKALQGEMAT